MKNMKILMLLLILGILIAASVPMVSAAWWDNDRHDKHRYLYDDGHYRIPNYWRNYREDVYERNPNLPFDRGYYMNLERQHRAIYSDYLRDVYHSRRANMRRGYN
ncbi:MAG: hypothetical protein KAT43_01660 [Nanoarchaeota archaeon]|nr:hypothetical protein [Nanoarchaeota archaeon]